MSTRTALVVGLLLFVFTGQVIPAHPVYADNAPSLNLAISEANLTAEPNPTACPSH